MRVPAFLKRRTAEPVAISIPTKGKETARPQPVGQAIRATAQKAVIPTRKGGAIGRFWNTLTHRKSGVEAPLQDAPAPKSAKVMPLRPSIPQPAQAPDDGARRGGQIVRIDSIDALPEHQTILTAVGSEITLPDSARKMVAALQVGALRAVIVLNGDGAIGSNELKSLKTRLRHANYEVESTVIADTGVFSSLIQMDQERRNADLYSDSAASIKLFDRIIDAGVRAKASDIHICIRENEAKVLLRINSLMFAEMTLQADEAIEAVGVAYNKLATESSREKSESQFNYRHSQYCMIDRIVNGERWRFRYQSIRVEGGLDVVLRLLRAEAISLARSLEDLGYEVSQQEQMRLALMKAKGAIFVAGVTGSGKSTTLVALMMLDPERHRYKSYSAEEPVEFRLAGISQVPVPDPDAFAKVIKVLLRGDPDTIMIGEIRDKATADLFAPAVLSGHRVLTTVHSSSPVGILSRLTFEPICMPRSVLTGKNFISALVYQALLPTLCDHCARPANEVHGAEYVEYIAAKFNVDVSRMRAVPRTAGKEVSRAVNGVVQWQDGECPHCRGGVAGQTVVAEIVQPDMTMLKFLREGDDIAAELYWRQQRVTRFDDPNMQGKTAFEHALYKSLQGAIDPRHIELFFESFKTYEIVPIDAD